MNWAAPEARAAAACLLGRVMNIRLCLMDQDYTIGLCMLFLTGDILRIFWKCNPRSMITSGIRGRVYDNTKMYPFFLEGYIDQLVWICQAAYGWKQTWHALLSRDALLPLARSGKYRQRDALSSSTWN